MMILGRVTAQLEARVGVFIEYGNGQTLAVDAVLDTGFSGYLCLPPDVVTIMLTRYARR